MDIADYWQGFVRQSPLAVVTDVDGTLLPFAPRPEEALPGPDVVALLRELAQLQGLTVALASGRTHEDLDRLFGHVPRLLLVAEHGGWRRAEGAWQPVDLAPPEALAELARELERITSHQTRALVERKTWSVALHYRRVPPSERLGLLIQADAVVRAWVSGHAGFERLEGVHAFEVRSSRIHKGTAAPWVREHAGAGAHLLALGDDLTDEDLFRALGSADDTILVGRELARSTAARWRMNGPGAALAFLRWIRAVRREGTTPPPPVLPRPVTPLPLARKEAGERFKLLAISNRLPALRTPTEPCEERKRGVGGLVSALEPALTARGGLWLGWSGRALPGAEPGPACLDDDVLPPLAWLDLPGEWVEKSYNGFCNRSLWPLFHSMPERVRFADAEWERYEQVNEVFAAAASNIVDPDTPIWVHDYHLLALGRALRQRGHRGALGLFLHIPFPGVDLFSMIPTAERLLDELLDFDLLGFHTPGYVGNFLQCVGALSPARVGDDVVEHRSRRIRVGAFPIGILPESFQELPELGVAEETAALLQAIGQTRLVIGVDRLDYTKGIPERLRAFGRLLELFPEWRGKVSLVQVSVPSRADIPEYAEQRALVENAVGRINGEFGEAHWVPVRYLYRSYGHGQLAQLYRASDVGYVTPLRDGMNLVAKEYVAAQDPLKPGVLLLSRFAGAAVELKDAVLTNPYHSDGMARDLDRALRMGLEERLDRHGRLLAAVCRTTAVTWAEDFLRALEACR
ncbi:MAG: trehalose-phosphatase [Planctomycetes bacterium]|nr:trehalose-phosphatase [Planctomycetota bacterium]